MLALTRPLTRPLAPSLPPLARSGVPPTVVAASLWRADDADAAGLREVYSNWTAFWRAHRAVLQAPGVLHLSRPTMRAVESVAHVDPAAPPGGERALLSLLNPTAGALPSALALPLYYAGFAPGAQVQLWRVLPGGAPPQLLRTATVGSEGGGVYDVAVDVGLLPPRSYALVAVTAA